MKRLAVFTCLLILVLAAPAAANPTPAFTWAPTSPVGPPPIHVTFDASSTICPPADAPCTYFWSHAGVQFAPAPGPVPPAQPCAQPCLNAYFDYQATGPKTVTLTVKNKKNKSFPVSHSFTITDPPSEPTTTLTSWEDADSPADPRDEDGDGDEKTRVTYSTSPDADGAEYSLDNGPWLDLLASPDALTVVLPGNGTAHNLRVRATRSSDGAFDSTPATAGPLTICPQAGCAPPITCDKFASITSGNDSNPGTEALPYATAYKLSQVLTAGQTGCLRQGTYPAFSGDTSARFDLFAGTSSQPITMRSYPGERATLTATIRLLQPWVVVDSIDAHCGGNPNACFIVFSTDNTISNSDITNSGGSGGSCIHLGGNGWGAPAARTVITRNKVHDCGPHGSNQVHAMYHENSTSSRVFENVFWGMAGYVVQYYPNANGNRFDHNVVANNDRAVVFGSATPNTSSNNEVDHNLITYTASVGGNAIRTCWAPSCSGPIGSGNTVHDNCMWQNLGGNFDPQVGYTQTNNTIADPQYVGQAAHDYRMNAGSACLPVVGYDTAALITW
jgi:hypothetical protein